MKMTTSLSIPLFVVKHALVFSFQEYYNNTVIFNSDCNSRDGIYAAEPRFFFRVSKEPSEKFCCC